MNRRRFLAATTPCLLATAGCLDYFEDEPTVRLGWLAATNTDTVPHEFELELFRDGELVHQSSAEVPAKEGGISESYVADCTWGEEAGEYVVTAHTEDGQSAELNLTDGITEEVDCVVATARYDEYGNLGFWRSVGCEQVDGYDGGCAFAEEL